MSIRRRVYSWPENCALQARLVNRHSDRNEIVLSHQAGHHLTIRWPMCQESEARLEVDRIHSHDYSLEIARTTIC